MQSNSHNDQEELLSPQSPPPQYAFVSTPLEQQLLHQQQQLPPTVIVNNTTVIHPQLSVPIEFVYANHFCNDTPRDVRRIFIRNLFLVIAAQFLLIGGIIAIVIFVPFEQLDKWNKRDSTQFYIIWIVSIAVLAIISFWERVRRIPPANCITMVIFTIFQGITLACAATFKVLSLVLLASVGSTSVVCLATALFEFQSRYHLGNFRSVLYVWTLNILCSGISLSFLSADKAGIAAGLSTMFCTYLVVNAQMMVHGTTHYVLTPKEYVFGAMNIYVDIVHAILVCLAGIGLCSGCILSCSCLRNSS
ncbi:protein lifeguard 2-like [Bradysia coprophila]|uniref:protein lifeguard 2-like n=1 Tax=Bradysia coprophila TaxID=38358 RepID=UPI00187DCC28|nr:protein lifeguard 2-like [Bradysia coprophila]